MKDLEILVLNLPCKKYSDLLFLLLPSVLQCFLGNSLGQNPVRYRLQLIVTFAQCCQLPVCGLFTVKHMNVLKVIVKKNLTGPQGEFPNY